MTTPSTTSIPSQSDFHVALICALPKEASCLLPLLDQTFESLTQRLKLPAGDQNHYTTGVIGRHSVVLAHMPSMGTDAAASVATDLRRSFPNIRLAIVVGICGGMPYTPSMEEILLGDVIISKALIRYDFGRKYPYGFERKTDPEDILGRQSPDLRAFLAKLEASQQLLERSHHHLDDLQHRLPLIKNPGLDADKLYQSGYLHQHRDKTTCRECDQSHENICEGAKKASCEVLGCEDTALVRRDRLLADGNGTSQGSPMIHYGRMGSGNTVMKSGSDRDQIAALDDIIALEMEGAGVWEHLPTIVVKGVCDYADSHKNKGWQLYAAATAAACTKAMLEQWPEEASISANLGQTRHSLMPYVTCTNHISRSFYVGKLKDFFAEWHSGPKRFVLWGLGGIGKTQIALEYAITQIPALSVFWIRADKTENFLIDYQSILEVLDKDLFTAVVAGGSEAVLQTTLKALESRSLDWLLVLDNADEIANFRHQTSSAICLGDYIPRSGRVIITTRNSEFMGELARPDNGIEVRPMSPEEGGRLIQGSVPTNLRDNDHETMGDTADELVSELGGLPLAIAQAAANMRHFQLPLSDYVQLYREKKSRPDLLSQPIHDSRLPPQSVMITWQMSYDRISKANPLAADLLGYLGFLHWQSIPSSLLLLLPEFRECSKIRFAQIIAALLNLSLLERVQEEIYQLHPMVHYWLTARLNSGDHLRYLQPILDVLAAKFPEDFKDDKGLAMVLLPHAIETIDQASETDIKDISLARLMQSVADCFFRRGLLEPANRFISHALQVGSSIWEPNDVSLLHCRKYRAGILRNSLQYEAAISECRQCLASLELVAASNEWIAVERMSILLELIVTLEESGRNEEAAEIGRELDAANEAMKLHSIKLDNIESLWLRNYYSHHLLNRGQLNEAERINLEVLKSAEALGPTTVPESIYLGILNTRGYILESTQRYSEAIEILTKVFERFSEIAYPGGLEVWYAAKNLASILFDTQRWNELDSTFEVLLESTDFSCLEGMVAVSAMFVNERVAIAKQKIGKYREAELMHQKTISASLRLSWGHGDDLVSSEVTNRSDYPPHRPKDFYVYVYNVCLAIARQGRMHEVYEVRGYCRNELAQAEAEYQSIEIRLAQDQECDRIHAEACDRLVSEGKNAVLTSWWSENKDKIETADWRLGREIHSQLRRLGITDEDRDRDAAKAVSVSAAIVNDFLSNDEIGIPRSNHTPYDAAQPVGDADTTSSAKMDRCVAIRSPPTLPTFSVDKVWTGSLWTQQRHRGPWPSTAEDDIDD